MGFDRSKESRFRIPVSDTQAYRQFGNAVVVPVVETIARHIAPWIYMPLSNSFSDGYQTSEKQKIPLLFQKHPHPHQEITP
jgi:mRNA-degrading endonuclease toxin of MazEF toxin-antitoxin module